MTIGSLAQFDIAKLELAKGDILVVRVTGFVTPEIIARAKESWCSLLLWQ